MANIEATKQISQSKDKVSHIQSINTMENYQSQLGHSTLDVAKDEARRHSKGPTISICFGSIAFDTADVIINEVNDTFDISKVSECSKVWKTLRDKYRRDKKKVPRSGDAATTSKHWSLFGLMSFLDPVMAFRNTSSNVIFGTLEDHHHLLLPETDDLHAQLVMNSLLDSNGTTQAPSHDGIGAEGDNGVGPMHSFPLQLNQHSISDSCTKHKKKGAGCKRKLSDSTTSFASFCRKELKDMQKEAEQDSTGIFVADEPRQMTEVMRINFQKRSHETYNKIHRRTGIISNDS